LSKIAVVILNWNGKSWLEQFLPTVILHSKQAEIYVVDNASTDDSVSYLQKEFPNVHIVLNDGNYGFAKGYNRGLKHIDAELYCLLNSDVEVTENWLEPILQLYYNHPEIAAIQPKILSYANKDKFEFAGAAGGFIDNLGYPYCRGRIFDETEIDYGQYDDEYEIFWASGCAFFIRSQDFWEQNGFDERFFAHQEEIDLCWRLNNSGRKIYYTSKSKVYHVGGGTLNKQSPQKTYLNFRNNLTMLAKNLPFPKVVWLIFVRLCLDGFSHLWAVVRAHFGFYAQLPESIRRRGSHQMKNYYATKWLIFKHFLK